jgi:hypothetical protein
MDFAGDSMDESENKNLVSNIRDMIRPKINFEDGLRWWQRGRRIKQRPFNMDGDECD